METDCRFSDFIIVSVQKKNTFHIEILNNNIPHFAEICKYLAHKFHPISNYIYVMLFKDRMGNKNTAIQHV